MNNTLIYSKEILPMKELNYEKLRTEIDSVLTVSFVQNIVDLNEQFVIVLNDTPLEQEILDLYIILNQHNPYTPQQQVSIIIQNAINFANEIMISFAAENVLMGITQAGKTKDVADYLANVMRYLQSGSLYEVINEVDRLINLGVPSELAPFVTVTRLQQFKQQIVDYLT